MIAVSLGTFADDLTAAMQACGQSTDLLQVGQEICLPGADLPGCANVKSYNNNDNCKVYIVQQGDTIESVAASLNIYQDTLNNLNQDVQSGGLLQPNKYLKLPPWSNTCGDPNQSGASCRVYIVQAGDYISGIASAFGVDVNDLLAVNPGLTADSVLQNNEPIKIPPFPASCGAGTPSKPPTDTVLKCRGYRVQQGDNIQGIAMLFQTTVADINAVNPEIAGGALVQPGTVIKIPPYDNTCTAPIIVTPNNPPSPPGPPAAPLPPSPPFVASPPVVVVQSPPMVMSPPMMMSPPPVAMAPSPAPMPPTVMPVVTPVPAPAPVELPPAVVIVSAPPPAPSAAVAPKAAMAAVLAVILALAF